MHIYLDNAATTKPKEEVVAAINNCYNTIYGNPSSAHMIGIEAEKVVKRARETVARALGVKPSEIIFTSGGTESNNTAIKGIAKARKRYGNHIITSAIEHPSVMKTCEELAEDGYQLTVLGVNEEGFINVSELEEAIRPETILVSVMHVNNEIGVIQPIEEIGRVIKGKNKNTIFHVDAVQSFGKIPIKARQWQIDLLSLSGHKIHGPKGIGALYLREGVRINPLLSGGGQENELRSGTENVPGIAGLGTAVGIAVRNMQDNINYLSELRDSLKNELMANILDIKINSPREGAAPHVLNVSFRGVKGEVLLHSLEGKDIYVSTGSACSSRKFLVSSVLKALNLSKSELEGAIRFSFSVDNTIDELKHVVATTADIVNELRKFARR